MESKTQAKEPLLKEFQQHFFRKITFLQLANGIPVVFYQDHRVPLCSFHVYFKNAFSYETAQEAGYSHFLEHMLFQGSEQLKPAEINGRFHQMGGHINAYTGWEEMGFYSLAPSQNWQEVISLFEQLVFCPTFLPELVEKERNVIFEEKKERENSPLTKHFETLMQATFEHFLFGQPLIGSDDSLQKVTSDSLRTFYEKILTPNNMLVVMTGHFPYFAVMQELEERFGSKILRAVSPAVFAPYRFQSTNVTEKAEVETSYLSYVFPGVATQNPKFAAESLAKQLLFTGPNNRIFHELKEEKQMISSASFLDFSSQMGGFIKMTMNPLMAIESVHQAFQQLLTHAWEAVTEKQLETIKFHFLSSLLYQTEDVESIGHMIKNSFLHRDPEHFQASHSLERLHRLANLQCDDVQLVLRDWAEITPTIGVLSASEQTTPPLDWKNNFSVLPQEDEKNVEVFSLANGTTCLLAPLPSSSVGLVMISRLGRRFESIEEAGLTSLLDGCLFRKTRHYTMQTYLETLSDYGIQIESTGAGNVSTSISYKTLPQHLEKMIALAAELWLHSDFDETIMENQVRMSLERLQRIYEEPYSEAYYAMLRNMFGNTPLGLPASGKKSTLQNFHFHQLKKWYQVFSAPRNTIISLAGNFDVELVKDLLQHYFGQKRAHKDLPPMHSLPEFTPERTQKERMVSQTFMVLGAPAFHLDDERFAASLVFNHIFGGGSDSLLHRELRETNRWVYSAASMLAPKGKETVLMINLATSHPQPAFLEAEISKLLERIKTGEFAEEELISAKNMAFTSQLLSMQDVDFLALEHGLDWVMDQPLNRLKKMVTQIQQVSKKDVQLVAQHFLRTGFAMGVVSPKQET